MYCTYCGTENDPQQRFCPKCGRPLKSMPEMVQQIHSIIQTKTSLSPTQQQQLRMGGKTILFKLLRNGLGQIIALLLIFALFIAAQHWSRPLAGQAPLISLTGHTQEAVMAVWSPDGKRIASGSNDNTVRVWDASNGRQLLLYPNYHSYTKGLAWSPDSKLIASIGNDSSIHIWNATTGNNEHIIHLDNTPSYLSWSPDGTRLAVSISGDETVNIVAITSGKVLYTFKEHTSSVYQIAWSPDGQRVASASADGTVRVWDPTGKGSTQVYRGPQDLAMYLAWSPDSKRIVSVSFSRRPTDTDTIQVWEVANLHTLYTYQPGDGYRVAGVAWSPDGQHIATSLNFGLIHVWNATVGHPIFSYRNPSGYETFSPPSWSPDSSKLVAASSDHHISIIEPRDTFVGQAYFFDLIDVGMYGALFLLLLLAIVTFRENKANLWGVIGLALVIVLITGACMMAMIVIGWNPLLPWLTAR